MVLDSTLYLVALVRNFKAIRTMLYIRNRSNSISFSLYLDELRKFSRIWLKPDRRNCYSYWVLRFRKIKGSMRLSIVHMSWRKPCSRSIFWIRKWLKDTLPSLLSEISKHSLRSSEKFIISISVSLRNIRNDSYFFLRGLVRTFSSIFEPSSTNGSTLITKLFYQFCMKLALVNLKLSWFLSKLFKDYISGLVKFKSVSPVAN
jgi:hypothetical protein